MMYEQGNFSQHYMRLKVLFIQLSLVILKLFYIILTTLSSARDERKIYLWFISNDKSPNSV
jgi:hypothetical protein